ncbi:hypothetical protein SynMEDNS5_01550 [Synechococcus sp. MEDNS5]|uniref:hypothetical protein n=1 Tax=Synechococcus sp. MEDNS5 TaxID=1442554 RepID=UPI0016459D1E|nr:hypothetical protein [Synechococcus sp. MEDNS5]QNJ06269.1 hypothetical protein SynMEDNS5_01550 [Synechococcus sp. MEDNS5]
MTEQEYLDQQESFLRGVEKDIAAQVRPEMEAAIRTMESLPDDASKAEYAAALAGLNDTLADAIGAAMFTHQRRIAEGAQAIGGGTIPPMKSPAELLRYGTVDSENIANQFERKTDV